MARLLVFLVNMLALYAHAIAAARAVMVVIPAVFVTVHNVSMTVAITFYMVAFFLWTKVLCMGIKDWSVTFHTPLFFLIVRLMGDGADDPNCDQSKQYFIHVVFGHCGWCGHGGSSNRKGNQTVKCVFTKHRMFFCADAPPTRGA